MWETLPDTVTELASKMLRRTLYVIHTKPVASRDAIVEVLPAHLQHQISLEKEGIMFGAGPLSTMDGFTGEGMIIVRAESFEAATAIAEMDPMHSTGVRSYSIQSWMLNEGSYTLTVNYSDQTVTVA